MKTLKNYSVRWGNSLVFYFLVIFSSAALPNLFAQELARTLILPQEAASQEGPGGGSVYPFALDGGRIQQVYENSAFPSLSPIIEINSIAFRIDGNDSIAHLNAAFQRITVILSTTPKSYFQMSTRFSANAGSDAVTVFDGPITFNAPHMSSGPTPFNIRIPFTTPFVYNRDAGHLLLELSRDAATQAGAANIDAFNAPWAFIYGGIGSDFAAGKTAIVLAAQ